MNILKASIATAAAIACCLGNDHPAAANYEELASFRSRHEMCHSGSKYCKHWTKLAYRCELGQVEIDRGNYSTPFRGYCRKAEAFRERITGIKTSTFPGAYDF